jgi:hypothetical protein
VNVLAGVLALVLALLAAGVLLVYFGARGGDW